ILGASGENIYPEAIESIINNFDFVEDSIVFQEEGIIVALVNLDKEALFESFEHFKDGAKHASEAAAEYSKELIRKVNKQLNPFSRITKLRHEEEPFEKTPKKTIKRYLYTRFKKDDSE
ncbi:MAG: long-chain fatty acid--CoA ligase, partial [Spirochaetes bacterium]